MLLYKICFQYDPFLYINHKLHGPFTVNKLHRFPMKQRQRKLFIVQNKPFGCNFFSLKKKAKLPEFMYQLPAWVALRCGIFFLENYWNFYQNMFNPNQTRITNYELVTRIFDCFFFINNESMNMSVGLEMSNLYWFQRLFTKW